MAMLCYRYASHKVSSADAAARTDARTLLLQCVELLGSSAAKSPAVAITHQLTCAAAHHKIVNTLVPGGSSPLAGAATLPPAAAEADVSVEDQIRAVYHAGLQPRWLGIGASRSFRARVFVRARAQGGRWAERLRACAA